MSPHLAMDALREQPVERADLLAVVRAHDGRSTTIARDAATGAFARVPVQRELRPRALSHDGRRVLFGLGDGRLVLHTLGAGNAATMPVADVGPAAFAPGGTELVALHQEDDEVLLTVLDPVTGQSRTVWSGAGTADEDLAAAWSPDGRFLAAGFLDPDDSYATVVTDSGGTTATVLDGMEPLGSSHRSWLGGHELLLAHGFWAGGGVPPIVVLDPETGGRREIRRTGDDAVLGAVGGRLLRRVARDGLYTEALDGSGREPFLVVGPDYEIPFVDVAPGV